MRKLARGSGLFLASIILVSWPISLVICSRGIVDPANTLSTAGRGLRIWIMLALWGMA